MRSTAVALIDGEHYPVVVADALRQLSDRFDFKAAVFLGGTEKITAGDLEREAGGIYGLPVVFDSDMTRGLARAIEEFGPEVVVDLSDEPVLGYPQRFRLISESLARNVGYLGSDFHFSPASSERLCTSPSLSVIGTGKRVGKTAISGYLARVLQEVVTGHGGSPAVVVVAMGRGGPAQPELVDGRGGRLSISDLLAVSRQGRHAASDHFEDALLSAVVTIGCRRCGGGMAGQPVRVERGRRGAVGELARPGRDGAGGQRGDHAAGGHRREAAGGGGSSARGQHHRVSGGLPSARERRRGADDGRGAAGLEREGARGTRGGATGEAGRGVRAGGVQAQAAGGCVGQEAGLLLDGAGGASEDAVQVHRGTMGRQGAGLLLQPVRPQGPAGGFRPGGAWRRWRRC